MRTDKHDEDNSCFLRFCEVTDSVGNTVFVKLGGKGHT